MIEVEGKDLLESCLVHAGLAEDTSIVPQAALLEELDMALGVVCLGCESTPRLLQGL